MRRWAVVLVLFGCSAKRAASDGGADTLLADASPTETNGQYAGACRTTGSSADGTCVPVAGMGQGLPRAAPSAGCALPDASNCGI